MTKSIRSKLAPLLGVALVATSLAIAVYPGTASADTSVAFADAADGLLDPAGETREGSSAGVTPDNDAQLPPNPLLNAGVLGQDTFVDRFGHSAACAGLVATSAQLNIIDPANGCANANASTGVELNLIPGVLTLGLDGVYAQCTAGSNQLPTADTAVLGNLRLELLGLGGAVIPTPPPGTPAEIEKITVFDPILQLPIDLDLPGVLTLIIGEENVGTTKGSGADATALQLSLLGITLNVGIVSCGPNLPEGDTGQLVMDTSGDIDVDQDPTTVHVQDGTRNALTFLYTPAGDRSDTEATFIIDTDKLEFDTADPAFAGCDPVGVNDPSTSCAFAGNGPGGILRGGVQASRTVPVKIKPGITGPISPVDPDIDPTVFATVSNDDEPGDDLTRALPLVGVRSESSTITVQAGGNAPQAGTPAGTQLPTTIPGFLFADMPYYVEYVEYDNVACTNMDNEDPPFVIPALYDTSVVPAQRNLFSCGLSSRATSDLRITVAPDAPTNVDGTGRIVILRTGPVPLDPPRIPGNSYSSDIVIDVTSGPVDPGDPDAPLVDIQKTVNSLPAPGGDFTYTLRVTNLDNEPARIEVLRDTITSGPDDGLVVNAGPNVGNLGTCVTGTVLAASNAGSTDEYTCTFTRNFTGDTGDTEFDQAYVRVRDTDGDDLTDDDLSAEVAAVIGNPHRLAVTKSVVDDDLPEPGGVFTYNVTITNDDDLFDGAVTITSVIDEISNAADRDLTATATAAGCTVLDEGESCAFQFTNTFTGEAGDFQDDVIVVEGTAADGPASGTSLPVRVHIVDDGGEVDLTGLDIDLTADPTSIPEPGGTTEFELTVRNTLPANGADLEVRTLKVQYNPTVDAEDMDNSVNCEVGELLEPGESFVCTFTDEIVGNAGDSFTYTAHATAEDAAGNDYTAVPDSATIVLTDVLPRIRVDETVEPASRKTPGGEFTWKVTVTNESKASSDPIQIRTLRNELTLDLEKEADCRDNVLGEILDVGESVSCTFKTKVEGPDGKVATDVVVVTAVDDEANTVFDFGNAAVSLTAADVVTPTTTGPTVRDRLVVTGANSRTTAAAAMLFAGLGLVLTGGGMQQAPELALEGQRRRRRRR